MTAPTNRAPAETLKGFATVAVRRSWQHMGASVALCAATFGWYVIRDAPRSTFVAIAATGLFLVVYNVVRIAKARRALLVPSRLDEFAGGQLQSHRVRGRIYLVLAPVVIAVTWFEMLSSTPQPTDLWLVDIGATLFLLVAWVWWFRTVRHMNRTTGLAGL
jgi:hypothetical protein